MDHPAANIAVYNCRSSAEWKEDVALSVTYSHSGRSTKAVLYGCTEQIQTSMINRLKSCNYVVHHPLTIPVLFCDIERNRQFGILEPVIRKFVNKAVNIAKPQYSTNSSPEPSCGKSATMSRSSRPQEEPEDLMALWIQVSDLKRGMETWKQQLENLISHCEELGTSQPGQATGDPDDLDERQFMDAGTRIKERLMELKFEYDEKIRQCVDIIDGMVLVAQLVRDSFHRPTFFPSSSSLRQSLSTNHGRV